MSLLDVATEKALFLATTYLTSEGREGMLMNEGCLQGQGSCQRTFLWVKVVLQKQPSDIPILPDVHSLPCNFVRM